MLLNILPACNMKYRYGILFKPADCEVTCSQLIIQFLLTQSFNHKLTVFFLCIVHVDLIFHVDYPKPVNAIVNALLHFCYFQFTLFD